MVWVGGLAVELLIALALWWKPDHAWIWALAAAAVVLIAGSIDHGLQG